jgi:hypothetical protein
MSFTFVAVFFLSGSNLFPFLSDFQAEDPWQHANAAMFQTEARNAGPSGTQRSAAQLPPVNRGGAVTRNNNNIANGDADGAGPSRQQNTQNADADDSADTVLTHLAAGVRAALRHAGYPRAKVDELMEKSYRTYSHPEGSKYSHQWSLKLPNGKRVTAYKHILEHPYHGGKVTANAVCHTFGCGNYFGHFGRCRVPHSDRHKVKPEDWNQPVRTPPLNRAQTVVPSPLSSVPPHQIAALIAKKKKSVQQVLGQAGYPPNVAADLVENATFKGTGVDKKGNIMIKFSIKLPNGVSVGNEAAILLNPYSLGGGGYFGGEYGLEGPRTKRQRREEETEEDESSSMSTSRSGGEEEEKMESEKEEEEVSRAKDSVGIVATEKVADTDEEGEDPSSSS